MHECEAKAPHKCNRSDLSHSIKEVEIVEGKISIYLCLAFCPTYLIGKCVDQREESALAILCTKAPKRRERETMKSVQ